MKIVTIDPGKVTGMGVYDDLLSFLPYFWNEEDRFRPAHHVAGADFVVVEAFTINNRTAQRAPDGLPLRIIGGIEQAANDVSLEGFAIQDLVFQSPATVMRMFTDDVLRALGWHTPGPDHARDAARHLAYFAISGYLPREDPLVVHVLEVLGGVLEHS